MSVKLGTFASGFKKARKRAVDKNGKHYTQESFADAFNISVSTVRNWEQGRTTPERADIDKLCAFFNCDMDYLFDRIDDSTHDIQFIQNYTGLDEAAISKLHETVNFPFLNKQLSALINSDRFISFIVALHDYINADSLYAEPLYKLEQTLKENDIIKKSSKPTEDELLSIAAKYADNRESSLRIVCMDIINRKEDKEFCSYKLQNALFSLEESLDVLKGA